MATTVEESEVFESSVVLETLLYKPHEFCVPEEASFKVLCTTNAFELDNTNAKHSRHPIAN